jgi:hypothetical protein
MIKRLNAGHFHDTRYPQFLLFEFELELGDTEQNLKHIPQHFTDWNNHY